MVTKAQMMRSIFSVDLLSSIKKIVTVAVSCLLHSSEDRVDTFRGF